MKQYCQVMQNRGITNLVYADQTRIRCAHTHLYVYGHTESLLKFDSRYLTWNSPANPMNHLTLKLTAKADNVLTNYFSEKKKQTIIVSSVKAGVLMCSLIRIRANGIFFGCYNEESWGNDLNSDFIVIHIEIRQG